MRLVLPETIWEQLLNGFADQPPTVERVAFLDGHRTSDGTGVVTTLVFPDADCQPTHYTVDSQAMGHAGAHFRAHGLVRLAQVHTHGGTDVRHSDRDDVMAYSQRPGSLSIVLPHHARHRPDATDALVHVRTKDSWRALRPDEAADTIAVVPSVIDQRRQPCPASHPDTKATWKGSWFRLMRRIRSLLRS